MRILLEDRKKYIATAPWVRRLKRKVACDGWMEGRKKCKKPAEWSYRRLRRESPGWYLVAKDEPTWSHFCWAHLISRGLYGNMSEETRWRKFQDEYPAPWDEELYEEIRRLNAESAREGEVPRPDDVRTDAEGGTRDGVD
jgi:hypothetical protein